MNLPTRKDQNKKYLKNCRDCGAEFYGLLPSIYCEEHRDPAERSKIRAEKERLTRERNRKEYNVSIKRENSGKTTLLCGVCGKPYEVLYYKKQSVYPKYCEEHRNEYRRRIFIAHHAQFPVALV